MEASCGNGPNDAQRDAAALWLMRRAGSKPTPSLEREFSAWLDADPNHERAYRDAARLWIDLEGPALRAARRQAQRPVRRRLRGLWIAGPTAAALAVVAVLCYGAHGLRGSGPASPQKPQATEQGRPGVPAAP